MVVIELLQQKYHIRLPQDFANCTFTFRIAHQSINGKYQSKMAMDSFPVLGHQYVKRGYRSRRSNHKMAFETVIFTSSVPTRMTC